MQKNEIWKAIAIELKAAKKNHPNWPDHPAAQAGVVVEEAGELMKACMQWKYERKEGEQEHTQIDEIKKEAIQTAVTAIRFLENFK